MVQQDAFHRPSHLPEGFGGDGGKYAQEHERRDQLSHRPHEKIHRAVELVHQVRHGGRLVPQHQQGQARADAQEDFISRRSSG